MDINIRMMEIVKEMSELSLRAKELTMESRELRRLVKLGRTDTEPMDNVVVGPWH